MHFTPTPDSQDQVNFSIHFFQGEKSLLELFDGGCFKIEIINKVIDSIEKIYVEQDSLF